MVQKQINNFIQINYTDNFSTADVTPRLLMDFEYVPGDQRKLYTLMVLAYLRTMTVRIGIFWKMTTYSLVKRHQLLQEIFTSIVRLEEWLFILLN
jgi:hypothetical protein